MQSVHTPNAPQPAGHYAQAIVHNGCVYVSGQLPLDPDTGRLIAGDAATQTRQALANVAAILEAAGSGLDLALQMTVYVANMTLWDTVNAAYTEILGDHRPARAVVPTKRLHHGSLVEIACIAALREEPAA